jgi:hypothetical protein
VPDGDLLGADEDVLDEQPQHPLAVFDGGGGGVAAQLGQEAFQVIGELEVGAAVGGLGVERVDLPVQVRRSCAQLRHPGAQLVDGQELLLEGLDHGGDRAGSLGRLQFEAVPLPGDRIGGAGGVQPLADLGADQDRGRTADLPLFRRICESRRVHHGPADRPYDSLAPVGVQDRPHVSRAVVSKALARSAMR